MFGSARSVNGSPRMFPVNDQTLRKEVIAGVQERDPFRPPRHARGGDLQRMRDTSVLAINVAGRQGHLYLTVCGGRAVTFMVFTKACEVYVLPLQFARARHGESGTLVRCTFAPKDGLLVLNDICGDFPLEHRIVDLHVLVHTDHRADPFLFPLRVVSRRFGNVKQASDIQALLKSNAFRTHSVSLFCPTRDARSHDEKRVLIEGPRDSMLARRDVANRRSVCDGATATALVMRVTGTEEYRVSTDGGVTWQYLCIKTLTESKHLEKVFARIGLHNAVPCVVASNDQKWRFLGPCA